MGLIGGLGFAQISGGDIRDHHSFANDRNPAPRTAQRAGRDISVPLCGFCDKDGAESKRGDFRTARWFRAEEAQEAGEEISVSLCGSCAEDGAESKRGDFRIARWFLRLGRRREQEGELISPVCAGANLSLLRRRMPRAAMPPLPMDG